MFVLEALVLTFMTTPVVVMLYPPKYRKRAIAAGANFDGIEDGTNEGDGPILALLAEQDEWKTRFTVVLDKMEHLPGIMTVAQLFRPFPLDVATPDKVASDPGSGKTSPLSSRCFRPTSSIIDALRLIELSSRTSAVMKSSIADSLIHTDPLLNVFKTFSDFNNMPTSASLSVVPFDGLAAKVADHARENFSQLILIPWLPYTVPPAHASGHHSVTDHFHHTPSTAAGGSGSTNPFDLVFNFGITEQSTSLLHSQFVRGIFSQSTVDVALFVDRGRAGPGHYSKQHIMLPFFGGPDDRLALAMVVQLCANPMTTAKILRVTKTELVIDGPDRPEPTRTAVRDKYGDAITTSMRENGQAINSVSLIDHVSLVNPELSLLSSRRSPGSPTLCTATQQHKHVCSQRPPTTLSGAALHLHRGQGPSHLPSAQRSHGSSSSKSHRLLHYMTSWTGRRQRQTLLDGRRHGPSLWWGAPAVWRRNRIMWNLGNC